MVMEVRKRWPALFFKEQVSVLSLCIFICVNVYHFEFLAIVLICTYPDVFWQIFEEFFHITNKDVLGTFRTAVDKYTPKLLRLYRARKELLERKWRISWIILMMR